MGRMPVRASESEDDDEPELEETPKPRRRRSTRTTSGPKPVQNWSSRSRDDEADEEDDDAPTPKRSVYFRARDSLWFEPVIALCIIILLLAGLFAYTQNWPPVYVVESDSMQHGPDDHVGLINTGDLVLAQSIPSSDITPYVVGEQTGYTTYGEFGDVLLYHPFGDTSYTPIIHRALLFLEYNPATGAYSAPDLQGLACSPTAELAYRFSTVSGLTSCDPQNETGTLNLYDVGWQSVTVAVPLQAASIGAHSGFVTMGDNNYQPGNPGTGNPDQDVGLSSLVEYGWVLGVARGMIPWYGSLKLLLQGTTSEVPSQSWTYMGLSFAGIILIAYAIHLAVRRYEDRREARRRGEAPPPDLPESFWNRLVHLLPSRGDGSEEDAEDGDPPRPKAHSAAAKKTKQVHIDAHKLAHTGSGRPKPNVHRPEKSKPSRPSHVAHRHKPDDDDDGDL
ncbi:MAG: S26 family signal peptidase [Thermoplasmata archaeon]|nr:S26 family signal peptidase [Thermoplasmata archaeon]